jgi:uncharacterized protein YkwD/uncharacterized membrane protein required for colicin V production
MGMTELHGIHWLDLILMLVLGWYAIDGWRRGCTALCFELLGFALSILLATLSYRTVGLVFDDLFAVPPSYVDAVAFLLVWWIVDLAWPYASSALQARLPDRIRFTKVNQAICVVPGVMNGVLISCVIVTVMLSFPLPPALKRDASVSIVALTMPEIIRGMDQLLRPALGVFSSDRSFELLTMQPWSDQFIPLRFRTFDTTADPESEEEMLRAIDLERFKEGLKPLTVDPRLRDVARAHARDMFERGYFAHIDAEGVKPYQRVERAEIPFGVTGENLALAASVPIAHDGLMASPGHRANILRGDFRQVGIGVIDGGIYGKMFVQVFTD